MQIVSHSRSTNRLLHSLGTSQSTGSRDCGLRVWCLVTHRSTRHCWGNLDFNRTNHTHTRSTPATADAGVYCFDVYWGINCSIGCSTLDPRALSRSGSGDANSDCSHALREPLNLNPRASETHTIVRSLEPSAYPLSAKRPTTTSPPPRDRALWFSDHWQPHWSRHMWISCVSHKNTPSAWALHQDWRLFFSSWSCTSAALVLYASITIHIVHDAEQKRDSSVTLRPCVSLIAWIRRGRRQNTRVLLRLDQVKKKQLWHVMSVCRRPAKYTTHERADHSVRLTIGRPRYTW
jgi:hypothetical protein